MNRRAIGAGALVCAVVAAGASLYGYGSLVSRADWPGGRLTSRVTPLTRTDPGQGGLNLVAFNTCADLLDGLRAAAAAQRSAVSGAEPALGADARAAAGAAPDAAAKENSAATPEYSGTNNYETGVDEPDLVKTDGKRIVTVAQGALKVVDVRTGRLTGSLSLPTEVGAIAPTTPTQILLSGDRALLLSRFGGYRTAKAQDARQDAPDRGPQLTLVDLSGQPRVLGTFAIDGWLVDARQVNSTVRVVVTSGPRLTSGDPAAAPVEDWLPRYRVDSPQGESTGRIPCGAVRHPTQYTGTSILTVLTFDLGVASLGTGDPVGIVGAGQTVYSTETSLYVATTTWGGPTARTGGLIAAGPASTEIYQFDTTGTGKPRFTSAGTVAGGLLNQYSLSEWNGHLRVVTTVDGSGAMQPGATRKTVASESWVYILRRDGGTLVVTGKVGGLGRGERVYSVRFVGPVGYVVTFRQTDPLYTLDLRDPGLPAVTGELELTGYSAYLHPIDADRLIGIGQEATTQGRRQGTLVSLFDVHDLSTPRRLARYEVRSGSSEAEFDPHAFLYWPATSMLVAPVTIAGRSAAMVLSISSAQITERGMIEHRDGSAVRRALVIDGTLWTVSATGLQSSDLGTLATRTQITW